MQPEEGEEEEEEEEEEKLSEWKKKKKNDYTGLPKESVSPNVTFVRGLKVSLHEGVRSGLKCCIWHKEATWTTIACFRGILKKANILGDSCPLSIKTTDVPYLIWDVSFDAWWRHHVKRGTSEDFRLQTVGDVNVSVFLAIIAVFEASVKTQRQRALSYFSLKTDTRASALHPRHISNRLRHVKACFEA